MRFLRCVCFALALLSLTIQPAKANTISSISEDGNTYTMTQDFSWQLSQLTFNAYDSVTGQWADGTQNEFSFQFLDQPGHYWPGGKEAWFFWRFSILSPEWVPLEADLHTEMWFNGLHFVAFDQPDSPQDQTRDGGTFSGEDFYARSTASGEVWSYSAYPTFEFSIGNDGSGSGTASITLQRAVPDAGGTALLLSCAVAGIVTMGKQNAHETMP